MCADRVVGEYDDWFLPSKDELIKLQSEKDTIGGFSTAYYWSSSEVDAAQAYSMSFSSTYATVGFKTGQKMVRAIRAF